MKTNNIIIHAIRISDKTADLDIMPNIFYPSVYREKYHATLQGNILTVQHKQYKEVTRSFALSYDMTDNLSHLFLNAYDRKKAYQIIQRMVRLKIMRLIKEVNGGV